MPSSRDPLAENSSEPGDSPREVEFLANLGARCRRDGQLEEAVVHYRQALQLQPSNTALLRALVGALRESRRYPEAIALCSDALANEPQSAEMHLVLGNLYQEHDDYDAAIHHLELAKELGCSLPHALNCLAIARYRRGDVDTAIELFRRSIALNPYAADAHFHLGMALLLTEQYEEGWEEYEYRPGGRKTLYPPHRIGRWEGTRLGNDQCLVLVAEQGFGDTIQFLQLVATLRKRFNGRLIVQAPSSLLPLLRSCRAIDAAIDRATPLTDLVPRVDYFLPLASLPSILQWKPALEAPSSPYLFASHDRVQIWRQRLHARLAQRSREPVWKVGICWQGDPRFPADRVRSIPLASFQPLADLPQVQIVSLQKGWGTQQLLEVPFRDRVIDFGETLDHHTGAFLDSLALMQELDLVVTSDTAIAHVAGAAGIPVWIALNDLPDWRWGRQGSASPWYPTARLFRQTIRGDWPAVFADMTRTLMAWGEPK